MAKDSKYKTIAEMRAYITWFLKNERRKELYRKRKKK